jgi:hypothetical protein
MVETEHAASLSNSGSLGNHKSVILSVAKDLRRYFGLNCRRVVFNQDMGKNRDGASEKDAFFGGPSLRSDDRIYQMVKKNPAEGGRVHVEFQPLSSLHEPVLEYAAAPDM